MKSILLTFLACGVFFSIWAQAPIEKTKSAISKYIKYWGIDSKVSTDTLNQWALWLEKGQDESLPQPDRTNSYKNLFSSLFIAMGDPDMTYKAQNIDNGIQAQILVQFGGFKKLEWPSEHKVTGDKSMLKVVKSGRGSIPVLVIPAIGYTSAVFERLFKALENTCTFYCITLPGFDNVPAYKFPDIRRLEKREWVTNVSAAVQKLIEQYKISPYLLLQSSSLGMGLQIATALPAKIKGIMCLGSAIGRPSSGGALMISASSNPRTAVPTPPSTIDYSKLFPISDFQVMSTVFPFSGSYQTTTTFNRSISVKVMEEMGAKTDIYAFSRFRQEMATINVREELKKITTPLLSLLPYHDELSPIINNNRNLIQGWDKFKISNPSLPIQLRTTKGRDLFFYEYPEEAAKAIADFVLKNDASKVIEATYPVNPSPAAFVSQTFSNTDVSVSYHRPAVKGRELFGKLIPYNKAWRAGANNATEITFSRDVLINNMLLARGKYSFFIIPDKEAWTFIFNRILNQWGHFSYDSTYDVLRVKASVVSTPQQEWLKYDFENLSAGSADLTVQWGDRKASVMLQETFQPALAPQRFGKVSWIKILDDAESDGFNKTMPVRAGGATADGKALYYFFDKESDSLWFRLETYTETDMRAPAVSISFDLDRDQKTGTKWLGSNNTFSCDLVVSCGPTRMGDSYAGWNGVTSAKGVKDNNWMDVKEDNVKYYFDPANKSIIIGLKRADVKPGLKNFHIIGSVGNGSVNNDDIGKDGTYATVELK